jgi:hypothetical protein
MGNLSQDLIDQMHLIKPLLSAFMAPETSVKSSGLTVMAAGQALSFTENRQDWHVLDISTKSDCLRAAATYLCMQGRQELQL